MTRASELLQYGQFTVVSAEFAVGASSAQGGRASRSNRLGNCFGLCGGQHAQVKFGCAVEFEIENRHRYILLLGNRKSALISRASVAIPAVDQDFSIEQDAHAVIGICLDDPIARWSRKGGCGKKSKVVLGDFGGFGHQSGRIRPLHPERKTQ